MVSQASFALELAKVYQDEAEKNTLRYQKMMDLLLKTPEPEVGLTPKEVIWTKNKAKLYHFLSSEEKKHPIPIMITYALINRPYILDLSPGNSLVEYLLQNGFDVYMIDWGIPGPEDKNLKFDDYILDYMPKALKKVLQKANSSQVNLLGYCMGGTMTAMFAALQEKEVINKMVLLASPIEFSQAGLYTAWLDKKNCNVDLMVDTMGNIPADMIDFGNKMLKPITNFISSRTNLWDRSWDERFLQNWRSMDKWLNDGTPFPGEAFRQWIKDFYQDNKLIKKQLYLRDTLVDLSSITCPVLNITGERDHIVPINQSNNLEQYINSAQYKYYQINAGHVSLAVGKTASRKVWPQISDWFGEGNI